MEDLKENIQKKNMEKLVLSAALSMFCYCSNNASTPQTTELLNENQGNNNNNTTNIENTKKKTEKTIKEEQDEECCPCCCCHNKESEGEKEQPKENETNPSNKKPNEIQLDTIKEEEQK